MENRRLGMNKDWLQTVSGCDLVSWASTASVLLIDAADFCFLSNSLSSSKANQLVTLRLLCLPVCQRILLTVDEVAPFEVWEPIGLMWASEQRGKARKHVWEWTGTFYCTCNRLTCIRSALVCYARLDDQYYNDDLFHIESPSSFVSHDLVQI